MKKLIIISLLIPMSILISQTEQILPGKQYLTQSERLISEKSPKITVRPYSGKKIDAIFIKYEIDSLFYYDLDTKTESKLALLEIKYILRQDGISVFYGIDYRNKLKLSPIEVQQIALKQTENTQTLEDSAKIENILNRQPSLMERSTIALERIALVQTYFMVYSIVVTAISILIILAT